MNALKNSREVWKGKSDEWLYERLNNELKSKIEEIHILLHRVDYLEKLLCDCQDYENGLVSNSCPIHNENPTKIDEDYPKNTKKQQ